MPMSLFRAAALSIIIFCSVFTAAQTPDTSTLQGTVADPSHAAITRAHISAMNETTGLAHVVDSDSMGRFTLAGLPVSGAYTISVTKDGFATAQTTHVELRPGSSAIVSLTLK